MPVMGGEDVQSEQGARGVPNRGGRLGVGGSRRVPRAIIRGVGYIPDIIGISGLSI